MSKINRPLSAHALDKLLAREIANLVIARAARPKDIREVLQAHLDRLPKEPGVRWLRDEEVQAESIREITLARARRAKP